MKNNITSHPGRISILVPDLTVWDLIFHGKTSHLICPILFIHVIKYMESQICILIKNFFLARKELNILKLYLLT